MNHSASLLMLFIVVMGGVVPAVTAAPESIQSDHQERVTQFSNSSSQLPAAPSNQSVLREARAPTPSVNLTPRRLRLSGPVTTNYSTVRLDFGSTLAISETNVRNKYRVSLVTVQLSRVDSQPARTAVVNAYLDAAVTELDNLSAIEARAANRYRRGEISAETFLVQLAMVHMRATAIQESIERVQRAAEPLPQATTIRASDLRMAFGSHKSNIRKHVARAAQGKLQTPANTIQVTVSANGAIVEMIEDGRYYRNAVRFDNRAPGGTDQLDFDIVTLEKRLDDIYPWAFDPNRINILDRYPERNIYLIMFGHPQGNIATYIDGATTNIYREEQTLILDKLPVADSRTASVENLSVDMIRTPRGGPFQLNVTKGTVGEDGNPSYEPVDAVVKVDGAVVGHTGADGELWVPSPRGEYQITVVNGNKTVNISVSPPQPPDR